MAKLTKRMSVIRDKVDATKQYDINEAIALLKELRAATIADAVLGRVDVRSLTQKQ